MPLPTVRGNKCCPAKKPARFIQVCKPLRYKPIEAIPCCALSNTILNSNYNDSKLLNQRVAVKKKSKWPLMRGKAVQTNDRILEDKMTQFPDAGRTVKEEEYVEYKVTRPSGSTETVHRKTTSDIKYDHLNLVQGIKLEQSVSKQIIKSGSMGFISLNTNYSEDTTDGRVYKKIESQSESVQKGKETRQRHIELVSSSKARTSTSQRSSRLSAHRRSSEKPSIGVKSGLSFRSRISAIEGSAASAEKSPRSGGGKVDSFYKDIEAARLPSNSIRHRPINRKRKEANSEVVEGLKKNSKGRPIQQSGLALNITVSHHTGILLTAQQSEGSECQSYDDLRKEQKQGMLMQVPGSATTIRNQNMSCDSILIADQLVQSVANKSPSITEEMQAPKTRDPSTNAPKTNSIDPKSRKPENASARGQSQVSPSGEERRTTEEPSPRGQSQVSPSGEERRNSGKSSTIGQSEVSPSGETRRPTKESFPRGQSQVSCTMETRRTSEKSSPRGQSQVSPIDEEKRTSEKSSQRGQSHGSPSGEERRNSEKSSPRGQSQVSPTGETRRTSEQSSPKRQSQVSSSGEGKRNSDKLSPIGESHVSPSDEERRNSEKSSAKRQSQVSSTGETRGTSEHSTPKRQSQDSEKYEGTSDEVKSSSKHPSNRNSNEEPKTDNFRFNDIVAEQEASLHQDGNNAGSQELVQIQNNEDPGNNSGQTKIKTHVYKSTEEEKVDADGTRVNSLYIDSISDMQLADNNNAELQTEESEETEYVVQINNCFRGPQCTNACGYCCSAYWRLCNMRGYNNRMNCPGTSNCNGQCCSYNCCRSRQR